MAPELVLSCFPGLDMLGMAFEAEGWCVVAGPDVVWGRDVRAFHPPPDRFDGIIGGDPCQSHSSLANLVRAKGLEPRFGDMTGEYARVIEEARPRWFLRENVPGAPDIAPAGYAVTSFLLNNAWLDAGDGLGEEQMRSRRFWFGWREEYGEAPNLMRWIRLAVFELPCGNVTVQGGGGHAPGQRDRLKRQTVTHRPDAVPVKLGGSGKLKKTAVMAGSDGKVRSGRLTKQTAVLAKDGGAIVRTTHKAVTGRHPGENGLNGGHRGSPGRYSLEEMMRLQGLDPAALEHAPFTMGAKRKLVGNGVALPTGRAVARAVTEALAAAHPQEETT